MGEMTALAYQGRRDTRPLPDWAEFLIKVGGHAATYRCDGRRLVVGLSLPARDFGAAFCAVGAVQANYRSRAIEDPRAHFEWLLSLEHGTRLRYTDGNKLKSGNLAGKWFGLGHDWLEIQTTNDAPIYKRRWDKCGDIYPVEEEQDFYRPRALQTNPAFVAAAAPGIDTRDFASHTEMECLLVGEKTKLGRDLEGQQFLAADSAIVGVLNDLVRCDGFEANANDHDRAVLVSAFDEVGIAKLKRKTPPIVIFDGPTAFLRTRANWRTSNWIVVLDRTSSSALDSGVAFNNELAKSFGVLQLGLGAVPPGVEIRAFEAKA